MSRLIALAAALAVAAALVVPDPLQAHGIRDQVNDDYPAARAACSGAAQTIHWGQTFVPARDQLVAIEVPMSWDWTARTVPPTMPPDAALKLEVREGGPTGPLLASSSIALSTPGGFHETYRPHFDLQPTVQNAAGRVLYFEVAIPLGVGMNEGMLLMRRRDGDPYPAGSAWSCGLDGSPTILFPPDEDWNFVTFGDGEGPRVCPQLVGRVPPAVIDVALANPDWLGGYNVPEQPARPVGPHNRLRTWLTMRRLSMPYHPVFNGLVWRAGCP